MTVLATMPKYDTYKESGFNWLGETPSSWQIIKLKHVLKFKTGGTPSSHVASYYEGNEPWVTISDLSGRYTKYFHTISQRGIKAANIPLVKKGELLFSFKLSVGQVAFTHRDLYTNEAIAAFERKPNLNLDYWFYAISQFLIKNAATNIYGAYILNQDLIKNAHLLVPPLQEQTIIANFLDKKTAQIDEAIAIKQKQIELLKERKKIIIQKAVTQGLDPNVPMRDSGVDWLGQIPKHWEIRRSKFLFTQRKEKAWKDDIQLSATQAYGVIPQAEYEEKVGRKVVKIQFHLDKRKHVELDDFVISMRSFQGGLERAWARGCIRSSYIILKPLEDLDTDFYSYLLKLPIYIKALQKTASFIRDGQDLNFENFSKVDLLIPSLEEQTGIAAFIVQQTTLAEKTVELYQQQIEKLNEYKTTLINSAVTGRIKIVGNADDA